MAEPQNSIQVVAPLHVSKFSASLPHLPYFLLADGIGKKHPLPSFLSCNVTGLVPCKYLGLLSFIQPRKAADEKPSCYVHHFSDFAVPQPDYTTYELALKHSSYPFFAT